MDVGTWRRAVIRCPGLTNGTRLMLVVMADYARQDGTVSVPRDRLADLLGIDKRRVSERMANALGAQVLGLVSRGKPGRTAVYQLMRPSGQVRETAPLEQVRETAPTKGAETRRCMGAETRTHPEHEKGAVFQHPSSKSPSAPEAAQVLDILGHTSSDREQIAQVVDHAEEQHGRKVFIRVKHGPIVTDFIKRKYATPAELMAAIDHHFGTSEFGLTGEMLRKALIATAEKTTTTRSTADERALQGAALAQKYAELDNQQRALPPGA